MKSSLEKARTLCPKCGFQALEGICKSCGFDAAKDSILSVGNALEVDLRNVNYGEWLKRKNIHVWIKDQR